MKRIRLLSKIMVFVMILSCTSVYSPTPALACMGPCPNNETSALSWEQRVNALKQTAQQYYNDVQVFMTRVAAVQQALQFAQEFYYYMQSLRYMSTANGVMGSVMNVTNAANGFMGMASQGLSAYNGLAQYTFGSANAQGQFQQNGYMIDPATLQSIQGGMSAISGGMASVANASASLGMLSQQNQGNKFLGMINGAQLTTQAVLSVGQGINGLLSYQIQKDQMAQNKKMLAAVAAQAQKLKDTPTMQAIPCRDMPIYLKAYVAGPPAQSSYNCDTMTMPQIFTPTDPVEYQLRVQIAQQMRQRALAQQQQLASSPQTAQMASQVQIPSIPSLPAPPQLETGSVPNYPTAVPVPSFTGGVSNLTNGGL